MSDVLLARLDALDEYLENVESKRWFREELRIRDILEGQDDCEKLAESLVGTFDNTVGRAARRTRRAVQTLRERVGVAAATGTPPGELWQEYYELYRGAQAILQEYLEFVGALAIRNKQLDPSIFRIADELVRKCSWDSISMRWEALTTPVSHDSVRATLAGIVRLRSPEWGMWILPFAAHELGRLEATRHKLGDDMSGFVGRYATKFAAAASASGTAGADDLTAWTGAVDELLADVFATYVMGPAYASAAVHLRLDPTMAFDPQRAPGDALRAHAILATLGGPTGVAAAGTGLRGGANAFAPLQQQLRAEWEAVRGGPAAAGAPPAACLAATDALVSDLLALFRDEMNPGARYGYGPAAVGWESAQTWGTAWAGELQRKGIIQQIPQPRVEHQLRDALNAAWVCRRAVVQPPSPDALHAIAEATRQLCERIIRPASPATSAESLSSQLTPIGGAKPQLSTTLG